MRSVSSEERMNYATLRSTPACFEDEAAEESSVSSIKILLSTMGGQLATSLYLRVKVFMSLVAYFGRASVT